MIQMRTYELSSLAFYSKKIRFRNETCFFVAKNAFPKLPVGSPSPLGIVRGDNSEAIGEPLRVDHALDEEPRQLEVRIDAQPLEDADQPQHAEHRQLPEERAVVAQGLEDPEAEYAGAPDLS